MKGKLQALGMKCLFRIKNVTVRNRIRHIKNREELQTKQITEYMETTVELVMRHGNMYQMLYTVYGTQKGQEKTGTVNNKIILNRRRTRN